MNIVVVGAGRVGGTLATIMSNDGHNVTVIDKDPEAFENLSPSFNGRKVQGIGFDIETLKDAVIENADGVAVVTQFDNVNIMVAETIRNIFGIKHVVARLFAPRKKKTFESLNLRSVCPTMAGAYQIYAELLSSLIDSKLPFDTDDYQFIEIPGDILKFEDIHEFEKKTVSKVVGVKTSSKFIFPWLEEDLADVKSWIVIAQVSHLSLIVRSIMGGK